MYKCGRYSWIVRKTSKRSNEELILRIKWREAHWTIYPVWCVPRQGEDNYSLRPCQLSNFTSLHFSSLTGQYSVDICFISCFVQRWVMSKRWYKDRAVMNAGGKMTWPRALVFRPRLGHFKGPLTASSYCYSIHNTDSQNDYKLWFWCLTQSCLVS